MATIITAEEWEVLRQHAAAAARREAARWPRHIIAAEDIAAEIMAAMVATPAYTRKLIDMGPRSVKAVVRRATWLKAHQAADHYRRFHGTYLYDSHRVRKVLEAGFLDPQHTPEAAEDETFALLSEERADLLSAIGLISTAHQKVLTGRYIGTGTAPTPSQVQRAVTALTYAMNNLSEERARLGGTTHRAPASTAL